MRTGGKRRPGKVLAIYIGVVIAITVIAYELRKDISFILICDKDCEYMSAQKFRGHVISIVTRALKIGLKVST